jgi:tetratricopeptide (TPR) repeat protein
MIDQRRKNEIVTSAPRGLSKQGSNLVSRGVDDLSRLIGSGESTEVWVRKANDFVDQKRWSEALACLEKVLELNQQHTLALYSKGMILVMQGGLDEALCYLTAAILTDPQSSHVWDTLQEVRIATGRLLCDSPAEQMHDWIFAPGRDELFSSLSASDAAIWRKLEVAFSNFSADEKVDGISEIGLSQVMPGWDGARELGEEEDRHLKQWIGETLINCAKQKLAASGISPEGENKIVEFLYWRLVPVLLSPGTESDSPASMRNIAMLILDDLVLSGAQV